MTSTLLSHTTHGITSITLNRPDKRNALTPEMIQALTTTLTEAATNDQSRIIVLRGQGLHFCAGADLAHMKAMAHASLEESTQDALQLATLLHTLYHFPKPTIAQVQGCTYGGGIGLVAACDIAITATDATFCFSEVNLGLIPAVISPFVMKAIGERAALALFMTATPFDANTAHELLLLQRIVPTTELHETITQQAKHLATLPIHALTASKALVRTVSTDAITPELMKKTALLLAMQRQHPDTKDLLSFE